MKTPFVAVGLVIACALLVRAQAGAPAATREMSLEQCWPPKNRAPANRAACERHRDDVMRLWKSQGSYYALAEIVEGWLEPGLGTMRRDDVVSMLGTQRLDRDYPNSRRDGFLVWTSNRLIPMGSYLIVQFGKNGIAQSYEWVSE